MKNFWSTPVIILLFAIPTFFSCIGHHDDPEPTPAPCNEKQETEQVTINGFDYTPFSPYFNQAVCVFKIKKESTKRSGNCTTQPLMECKNLVSIKNLTPFTISFSYTIKYLLNAYRWEYQNTITIAPGQTTDFDYINDNCGSLQLANRIDISSTQINYY